MATSHRHIRVHLRKIVSIVITVVRVWVLASARALFNESMSCASITWAPRLRAFCAKLTGRMSPVNKPVSSSRKRYLVPNRCEPMDCDNPPILANPLLFRRIILNLSLPEWLWRFRCSSSNNYHHNHHINSRSDTPFLHLYRQHIHSPSLNSHIRDETFWIAGAP